jgi:acetyltransferase-like isoleucine patch superfamily enzyme
MKRLLIRLVEQWARRSVERRSSVNVATTARVNWRGLKERPPGRLVVGEGSIFEGSISSDRSDTSVLIGHRTFVGCSALVTAERIEIGDDVLVSWGCTIVDHDSHNLHWSKRSDDVAQYREGRKRWDGITIRPVSIGNRAWIGFNTIILKGVRIGEGAVVAAGSVVTRDVAPFTLVAGNPARVIRQINDEVSA